MTHTRLVDNNFSILYIIAIEGVQNLQSTWRVISFSEKVENMTPAFLRRSNSEISSSYSQGARNKGLVPRPGRAFKSSFLFTEQCFSTAVCLCTSYRCLSDVEILNNALPDFPPSPCLFIFVFRLYWKRCGKFSSLNTIRRRLSLFWIMHFLELLCRLRSRSSWSISICCSAKCTWNFTCRWEQCRVTKKTFFQRPTTLRLGYNRR